jgi:hypothetical protein
MEYRAMYTLLGQFDDLLIILIIITVQYFTNNLLYL